LKKGYDALQGDPSFFGTPDAMVTLGTGKNMVRSIRHWGIACRVWEEIDQSRGRELQPTEYGNRLLADKGWDPFIEDIGTIWFLHWRLVTNPEKATTWSWVFGRPRGNRFSKDEVIGELEDLVSELGISRTSRSSLKRDVDVLLRSYSRAKAIKGVVPEDSLDSPFVLLELLRPAVDKGHFEVVEGPHPSLPVGVFEACLVEFFGQHTHEDMGAISLDDLRYSPASPGRVFRLSERTLLDCLEGIVKRNRSRYVFDETAGIRQLMIIKKPKNPLKILDEYYSSSIGVTR
jgi:hypothetical protein